jgi:hypothetical protein
VSDDELLERIRLDDGYLLAHGRYTQCDHVRELCKRYARMKTEADQIKAENRAITQALYELRMKYNAIIADCETAPK